MFLLRTIRRRLVTLYAAALAMLTVLGGIGIHGLLLHQEVVDDLDFLLHRSPNQEQLSRAVSRISESLCESLDLRKGDAVRALHSGYVTHVKEAESALFDFRRRIESLPLSSEMTPAKREQVLQRLDRMYGEIGLLARLSQEFRTVTTDDDLRQMEDVRMKADRTVVRIQRSLEALPAYHAKTWVSLSLEKERQRSAWMLRILLWSVVLIGVFFVGILVCGFRWISDPVRVIAQGCTRIANGDIHYRLSPASKWQDEIADLVAGVNCVADRFQQAEDDLLHKVRERSEQLVRSQKLANVGFLAAGVAHEINNPLMAISIAAESVEARLHDLLDVSDPEAQEVLDRITMIRKESLRCGDITSRLLNFSRSEKTDYAPADITDLVREVLAIVHHLGQFRDRVVEFESNRPVIASVNAAQIKQVILNLVANALQATRPGGKVTIRLCEQVDNFVLSVSDDGCGMDTETLQQVFDPFYTNQLSGSGTGLGLSITHRIIEDHGGTITPISEGAGFGSTFQVRLPRRKVQSAAA